MPKSSKARSSCTKARAAQKPMGRPPFEPTTEQRERAEILIAGGMAEEDIARVFGLSRNTLAKHFGEELATGRAKRRAEILMAQYRTALAGNASAQEKFLKKGEFAVPAPAKPAASKEKVGKKEQAKRDAQAPNLGTTLGDLMAQRMRPN